MRNLDEQKGIGIGKAIAVAKQLNVLQGLSHNMKVCMSIGKYQFISITYALLCIIRYEIFCICFFYISNAHQIVNHFKSK